MNCIVINQNAKRELEAIRGSCKGEIMKSQTEAILEHLNAGNTLTSLEALDRFGCLRLASRITDIKQLGFDIESTMVKRNNKRFAEYRLLPNKRDLFV